MKIQPLAAGVLGLIATGGIVYGAVSSVEPASDAPTSNTASSDSSSPLPSEFPILETPVASAPAEASFNESSPEPQSPDTSLYQQLEGTWSSDMMTVTFSWDQGVYSGVLLDQPFTKSLEFVREQENAVVFKASGSEMICEFQADGAIALMTRGEDNPPIVLRKSS